MERKGKSFHLKQRSCCPRSFTLSSTSAASSVLRTCGIFSPSACCRGAKLFELEINAEYQFRDLSCCGVLHPAQILRDDVPLASAQTGQQCRDLLSVFSQGFREIFDWDNPKTVESNVHSGSCIALARCQIPDSLVELLHQIW